MPRGYLKRYSRQVGLKRSRGNASRRSVRKFSCSFRHHRLRSSVSDELLWYSSSCDDDFDEEYDEEERIVLDERCPTQSSDTCCEEGLTSSSNDDDNWQYHHEEDASSRRSTSTTSSPLLLDWPEQAGDEDRPMSAHSDGSSASYSLCESVSKNSSNEMCWKILPISSHEVEEESYSMLSSSTTISANDQSDHAIVCLQSQTSDGRGSRAESPQIVFTCAICLEPSKADGISRRRFMKKCRHPTACQRCLIKYYLQDQILSHDNFPLRCFWPGCHRLVRNVQIQRLVDALEGHGSSSSSSCDIMKEFYQQEGRARSLRRFQRYLDASKRQQERLFERRVWHLNVLEPCVLCETLRPVYPGRCVAAAQDGDIVELCRACGGGGGADSDQPRSISYLDFRSIVDKLGEDLVNCPSCRQLIQKNGGCNHMTCTCGAEFSFDQQARAIVTRAIPPHISFRERSM